MRLDYEINEQTPSALVLAEELAKPFERCFLRAYHDPIGLPTQGWGHLLSRVRGEDLSRYPDWDQATSDRWLQSDLRKADASVSRLFPMPLRPHQRAPLIDFAFNLGAGNLQSSTLRRLVLRGDFDGAADQFLRWDKAGGRVFRGLTKRCRARRALFLSNKF